RRILDRPLDRRDVAQEAHGVGNAELPRERAQSRLERPATRDLELERGQLPLRERERAEQDDLALDRDQPADAEQARRLPGVRRRFAAGRDPVVNDLEAALVEAFRVREVPGEAARDRDVDVREARDRAVAESERPPLAELVEA